MSVINTAILPSAQHASDPAHQEIAGHLLIPSRSSRPFAIGPPHTPRKSRLSSGVEMQ
jgi:hypothetical protein